MHELVLIVEDEKDTVELLRYNLEKEGYRTMAVQTGDEAIAALQAYTPDIMLLDIMLPGLNGWETCNALRSKGVAIPIVMLTALSTKDDQIKGLTLGADDYLPKPFSVKELMLRIKRLLEKERAIKILQTKEREGADSLRYLVHELKNSLNVIGGSSSLAIEKGNDGMCMNLIKSSALHMECLLTDASLLAKLENGDGILPMQTVDIESLIEWAVNIVREDAEGKEVDIHQLNSSSCMVIGNTTAIRQVLLNVLSNAVKYNRRKGKIWVFINETNESIEVSVRDTGYGIPTDEQLKVFEKFYRAKGSEKTKGTGLGLYLVKLLMDTMGGIVAVNSKEGVGSTFTISFKKGGDEHE